LRVHLGLTQQGLGKLLGDVSENAVSLWERKDTVPAIYDHWLRMLVLAKLKGNTKVADAVQRNPDRGAAGAPEVRGQGR